MKYIRNFFFGGGAPEARCP